jgi:hypothetical protein
MCPCNQKLVIWMLTLFGVWWKPLNKSISSDISQISLYEETSFIWAHINISAIYLIKLTS